MNLKVRVESNTKQQVFHGANMDKSEMHGRGAEFEVLSWTGCWGWGMTRSMACTPAVADTMGGHSPGTVPSTPSSWFDISSDQTLADHSLVKLKKSRRII